MSVMKGAAILRIISLIRQQTDTGLQGRTMMAGSAPVARPQVHPNEPMDPQGFTVGARISDIETKPIRDQTALHH